MNKLMTLSNSCNGNSNRFGHDIWSCHKIWNLATSCNIPRFKHKHGEDTSRCLIHQVWNIKNSKHVKTLWYNETWRLGKSPIHLVDLPTKKKPPHLPQCCQLPEGFSIAILTYFPLLDDQNVAPVNCCFYKMVGGWW